METVPDMDALLDEVEISVGVCDELMNQSRNNQLKESFEKKQTLTDKQRNVSIDLLSPTNRSNIQCEVFSASTIDYLSSFVGSENIKATVLPNALSTSLDESSNCSFSSIDGLSCSANTSMKFLKLEEENERSIQSETGNNTDYDEIGGKTKLLLDENDTDYDDVLKYLDLFEDKKGDEVKEEEELCVPRAVGSINEDITINVLINHEQSSLSDEAEKYTSSIITESGITISDNLDDLLSAAQNVVDELLDSVSDEIELELRNKFILDNDISPTIASSHFIEGNQAHDFVSTENEEMSQVKSEMHPIEKKVKDENIGSSLTNQIQSDVGQLHIENSDMVAIDENKDIFPSYEGSQYVDMELPLTGNVQSITKYTEEREDPSVREDHSKEDISVNMPTTIYMNVSSITTLDSERDSVEDFDFPVHYRSSSLDKYIEKPLLNIENVAVDKFKEDVAMPEIQQSSVVTSIDHNKNDGFLKVDDSFDVSQLGIMERHNHGVEPEIGTNDPSLDGASSITRDNGSTEESAPSSEAVVECYFKEEPNHQEITNRDFDVTNSNFLGQSIATVHDLSEEANPNRLTESQLQLGKSKPYWIPDEDCSSCMLCASRFSLLNRRHHCRACGRVLCGSCCKDKAVLQYMKDEPKKNSQARVCSPCASMLARIEEYEKKNWSVNEEEEGGVDDVGTSSVPGGATRSARGVLKTRAISLSETESDSTQSAESTMRKRSVIFRDGVKPGAACSTVNGGDEEERSTTVKPKKKSRKRHAVARRIAELRMEDELGCALPTETRNSILVVYPDGEIQSVENSWIYSRFKDGLSATIVLKKNLTCVVQICSLGSNSVWCVSSRGFTTIGLDELLFVWQRDDLNDFSLPINVLQRVAQIFTTALNTDNSGVRRVCSRLPVISSVPAAIFPLTKHIMFFAPTFQDFSCLPIPSTSFMVALFLHDSELQWAMACPNRILFRLGLKYSWYPTPIVNMVGRDPVYSSETGQTVLKVFTDFRNWSFRLRHVPGCTVTLCNDITLVNIHISAKNEITDVILWNRSMLAWTCDVNLEADSHLVCDESNGFYSTQVLARGSTRKATGTSFVIIDGGLKTNKLQVSVVEDGVAIRMNSERLEQLLESLSSMKDWSFTESDGIQLVIRWTTDIPNFSPYASKSTIDGLYLGNKFQYGLSLDRAISSVLQVCSVPEYGVRLSHVYNLKDGRLHPDEEPKIFSVAEMLARECTGMLEPYLPILLNINIDSISVRVGVSNESVEYDVSPWFGMEEEHLKFKQSMDQLIPVLYNIMDYLAGGFLIEFTLSFISTKTLPIVM